MRKICWIVMLLLPFAGCVSELEIDLGDQQYIMINGVLTNSPMERNIYVSRRNGLDLASEERISAKASIFKNGIFEADLEVFVIGELFLPESFLFEEGETYHLEITTFDRTVYQTIPQTIQPKMQADSMSYKIEIQNEVDLNGEVRTKRLINVFVHLTLPQEEQRFFRWQVDEAWALKEVPDPNSNFDVVRTCYLTKGIEETPSTILSPAKFQTGSIAIKVASRLLDESFLEKHFFNAYTHTIDETNYKFYERAEKLILNIETFYDEIPAPVKGNVYNPADKNALILGHIEMALTDTVRLSINRDEIPAQIANECEVEKPCPELVEPTGFIYKSPCYCHDCDKVYGREALNKPSYWNE